MSVGEIRETIMVLQGYVGLTFILALIFITFDWMVELTIASYRRWKHDKEV